MSDPSDNDYTRELLRLIQAQLTAQGAQLTTQAEELRELREALIRIETHGYNAQIGDLRLETRGVRDKVIVLETQGRFFAAGVAAGVSVIVSVLSGLMLWALKT